MTTMSKEAKKVGVIGAGIIGIVVASCLQRGGHEVFVVDRNEPGKGRSVRIIAADLGVDESTVRSGRGAGASMPAMDGGKRLRFAVHSMTSSPSGLPVDGEDRAS
jgi:glycine/D-amino acid oxidase-like deaminating enzyme